MAVSVLLVWMLLFPVVILPGAAAWLFALLLEPVFARYQKAEMEEETPEETEEV